MLSKQVIIIIKLDIVNT